MEHCVVSVTRQIMLVLTAQNTSAFRLISSEDFGFEMTQKLHITKYIWLGFGFSFFFFLDLVLGLSCVG